MEHYLRRLLRSGASYQAAEAAAKGLAVFTLPLYTRHVSREGYGAYQALFTAVVLGSILLRLGLGEAFLRLYYNRPPAERRLLGRTFGATVLLTTTCAAGAAAPFAGPVSRLLLGGLHPRLIYFALLGLWAFTNLEVAYAQLRAEERASTYLKASLANVALTIAATIPLVVFLGEGARGLLLGNFGATALVVVGLWLSALRDRIALLPSFGELYRLAALGLPTLPAEAAVYGLQVADRIYLFRAYNHAAAGEYSVALQLATVVFVFVRGFQYAWPPLAYSVAQQRAAVALYARVTTYLALATATVVCAVALIGRWLVRLLAAPTYFGAHRALPLLALAWALYGLYLAVAVIPLRALASSRTLPAALLGLGADIGLLFALVPKGGAGLGLVGAGVALCGAYLVMILTLLALTRTLLPVPFEWGRLALLAVVASGVALSGELLLPTAGAVGLFSRIGWFFLLPLALLGLRFFVPEERQCGLRALFRLAGGSRT